MRKLIPLTIYLTEEEFQLLLEQTKRSNELSSQFSNPVTVEPEAVAGAALTRWLKVRKAREAAVPSAE